MSDEQELFGGSSYRAKAKRKAKNTTQKADSVDHDKPVSYRIGQPIQDRINETALAYQVGKSDLVKFLLRQALDQLESGDIQLKTTAPKPQKFKIEE